MTELYDLSIPPLFEGLASLKHLLEKAQSTAAAQEIDDAVFTDFRLYPDMRPLRFQVYFATDIAKFCAKRLGDATPPSFEDNQISFDDLLKRVEQTIDFLKSVPRESIDGNEGREITLKNRFGEQTLSAMGYVQKFLFPNFYFHLSMTYAMLRHNGVELGKMDFLFGQRQGT